MNTLVALLMATFAFTHATIYKIESPRADLEAFYRAYINEKSSTKRADMKLKFTDSFDQLVKKNFDICKKKKVSDVCGWDGKKDMMLNSTEWDENLTPESAQFKAKEMSPDTILVTLNPIPQTPKSAPKNILYRFIKEAGEWRVNDITYEGKSLRQSIEDDTAIMEKMADGEKPKVKSPREIVESFYQQYIEVAHPGLRKSMSMSFSRGFHKLTRENDRLCRLKAGDELCGWNASGDIYLDAQEYEQPLTVKSSGLTVTELAPDKINVKLNVYPSLKKDVYSRDITFYMIKEVSEWVVADVLYRDKSLRQTIKKENEYLQKIPKPAKPKEMHKEEKQNE